MTGPGGSEGARDAGGMTGQDGSGTPASAGGAGSLGRPGSVSSPRSASSSSAYHAMGREELLRALEMFAKSWLAHDGCWFLAAEERLGMEAALELDRRSWERFAVTEAHRILETFRMETNGGLPALEKALGLRMYALINEQRVEWSEDRSRLRFVMEKCRVQEARRRKGLPDFPCKSVGIVEFSAFARTIDSRIRTECLGCPPEAAPGAYCSWEFTIGAP